MKTVVIYIVGLGGGSKTFFPKYSKFGVCYFHEWHMQRHNFLGPHPMGPWGSAIRSNIINFQLQSISKMFKLNFVCLLTNARYKTNQKGFSFGHLSHAPGVGRWGVKKCFSKIQPDLVCELRT